MQPREQFISIQYLRGLAALCVVVYHLEGQVRRMGYAGWWPDGIATASGVDLFFVISGFIMWTTTADGSIGSREFIRRRLARIVPLYWLFTTVILVTALVLPQALQTVRFEPVHAIASYFFVPYPEPGDGAAFPLLIPGWTLNYEIQFYAIFAVGLLISSPVVRLLAIAAVLVALTIAGYVFHPAPTTLAFWTNSLIIEFLFGMLVGAALHRLPGYLLFGGLACAFLASFAILGANVPRFITVGIPAAALVLAVVKLEEAKRLPTLGFPRLLGDASYALYLSHVIVLSAFGQLWRRLPLLGSTLPGQLLFVPLAISLCVVVGIGVHLMVERPLGRLLRRAPKPPAMLRSA